ncbi:hypothetical protein [Burkholderia vietnamiensis]|jgi:hypothetical protein|uniref:hypothetical protein n=1 Tax=Burkholderia vietnamiensis TaxID=60552 RepID=UPI001CF5AE3E|nr:hypothetical protein [Burkholderia vietnamiensis]MCA8198367.1 hypothetical protein [Burkholderia vietnamiensis]
MMTIAVTTDPVSGALAPATPIPGVAIAIVCDGTRYIVYEPGDTPPTPPNPNVGTTT